MDLEDSLELWPGGILVVSFMIRNANTIWLTTKIRVYIYILKTILHEPQETLIEFLLHQGLE